MKHCMECGDRLVLKECNHEGSVPFCPSCNTFRFPIFNAAVSCLILNPTQDKLLLIQQYGRPDNVLVAGYINKGEDAESTVIREIHEETGLTVSSSQYLRSQYYERSNTLMFNFLCVAESEDLSGINHEVDQAAWFSIDEAQKQIKPNSLAKFFLMAAFPEQRQE